MEKYHMSWVGYDLVIQKIIKHIKELGLQYKVIGTFLRGGYVPAVHMANHLNIPYIVNLNTYTDYEISEMEHMLVVDDISDTGNTLLKFRMFDIACICYKKRTKVIPSFFSVFFDDDIWVVFPWEPHISIERRDRD